MKFLHFTLPLAGKIVEGSPYRVDTPAIPYKGLREAILNALVHRDYSMKGAFIDIAVYDDRVEIDSPGCLPDGIELQYLIKKHKSILRNPIIANVLYTCGLIEQWGRGTLDIIELSKKSNNPVPRFEETTGSFTVIFPFKEPLRQFAQISTNQRKLFEMLTPRQKKIVDILKHGSMSREQIMENLSTSVIYRTVQRDLAKLNKVGLIEQKGVGKNIIWELTQK